jgi:quercetin dioxygenase-like cupin family protein
VIPPIIPQQSAICDDIEKIGKRYALFIGRAILNEDNHVSSIGAEALMMKKYLFQAAAIALLFTSVGLAFGRAAQEHIHKIAFTPDTIHWGPAPPVVQKEAQFAVLEGDPTASSGDYTIRLKMPDGFRIAPHWHPLRENVTVISGTFRVGMGDEFETSKMNTFASGSFAYMDPDMHHYAMASGETVVQVHGQAPLQFNYVNPKDDPSKK